MAIIKTINLIMLLQDKNTTYQELVEFLFGEIPPADHNFLRYDYKPFISRVVKFNDSVNSPQFSVIIPTYNRAELLAKNIASVASQKAISKKDFEIIVVDNGSQDKTEETAAHLAASDSRTNMLYIKLLRNYGGDFARNIGVLHSRGKLIVFTDDDCIVPADWLFKFGQEFKIEPKLAGVGGFKLPESAEKQPDIYHRFLMWGHFLQKHVRTKDNTGLNRCGLLNANVCYRKEIFEKIGGFNTYFKHIGSREFKARLHKAGARLLYEPRMVEHSAKFTLASHITKLFPQGWDWHLLHLLHPDVWPNPSFAYFLKRMTRDIRALLKDYRGFGDRKTSGVDVFSQALSSTSGVRGTPDVFRASSLTPDVKEGAKSLINVLLFSCLSIITNFFLWLGKYWVALALLEAREKSRMV